VKLAQVGEDQIVAALTRDLPLRPDVRVGAGDDCAVIGGPRDRHWQLLKTDAVIEGVHFTSGEDRRRVGWKALCRAISDIGAMGGLPEHALVTLAVSPKVELTEVQALYSGLRRAARKFDVAIVGGETSRSPGPLFVSIALTGSVERSRCVLRSGGQPDDVLFVTGKLGGSITGHHLDFVPRLAEARWLVSHFPPTAMMDLSDGLAADLPRLAGQSRCSYEIDNAQVPVNRGCTAAQAFSDGEDYELLFSMRPALAEKLPRAWRAEFPKVPLSAIGRLLPKTNHSSRASADGFDHFA
jgi:thiamine-monophosphate kinase